MLPLLVGALGAIGAAVSAIKGGSWIAGQLGASGSGASVGGKAPATNQTEAAAAPFAQALAAQAAGQSVPVSGAVTAVASTATPSAPTILPLHSTQYDVLARMNAGIAAYNHISQHQPNPAQAGALAASVTPS